MEVAVTKFRLAAGMDPRSLRIASVAQERLSSLWTSLHITCVMAGSMEEVLATLDRSEADAAACCAADLPLELPQGLVLSAILPGRDAAYRFASRGRPSIEALAPGSSVTVWDRVARAQLLFMRPSLRVSVASDPSAIPAALRSGPFAAAILPGDALDARGLWGLGVEVVPMSGLLPAPGQGAVALVTRIEHLETRGLIADLNDEASRLRVCAERSFARRLSWIERFVVAAHAGGEAGRLDLAGRLVEENGGFMVEDGADAETLYSEMLAKDLADSCVDQAIRGTGEPILKKAAAF